VARGVALNFAHQHVERTATFHIHLHQLRKATMMEGGFQITRTHLQIDWRLAVAINDNRHQSLPSQLPYLAPNQGARLCIQF
jgi:hypothetical protein